MKKKEIGQGLVAYNLILVLVAIVVLAVLLWVGPDIDEVYNQILCAIGASTENCPEYGEVSNLNRQAIFAEGISTWIPELDNVVEKIEVLMEQGMLQEEMIGEGINLDGEAFVESLEILLDYAEDLDNQLLFESLSQLMVDFADGNYIDLISDAELLKDTLTEVPYDVAVNYIMKITPLVAESCQAFTDGIVTTEAITEALFALEQLDDEYPGKAEALHYLNDAVDIIENRNTSIGDIVEFQLQVIDSFIDYLITSGEEELATQLAEDSEVCTIP